MDILGSEDVRQTYQKSHKPLKADEILAQRSVIPAVASRKRSSSRITDGIMLQSNKKQKRNWVSTKELQRVKDSLDQKNHLSSTQLEHGQEVEFDLWSGDHAANDSGEYDYLVPPKPKVAPITISHAPIAMTANGKAVKAIKTPTPGTSYNPSFTDWDDLLNQEGLKAIETEKKRIRAEQLDAERAPRIVENASEDVSGTRTDDESAWEGFESEYDGRECLTKKRPERKTQAERNKIKRRKDAEGRASHLAKMADRRKQTRELEQLAKSKNGGQSGIGDEVEVLEDDNVSSEGGDDSMPRRKRLRNVSIPEKHLEVILPDELQESLRRLKPEGNLLNDRFRHLLINGKVEARKPILQPKKKRVTYTEKWTYKDFQILV